jgi:hypothetical protein
MELPEIAIAGGLGVDEHKSGERDSKSAQQSLGVEGKMEDLVGAGKLLKECPEPLAGNTGAVPGQARGFPKPKPPPPPRLLSRPPLAQAQRHQKCEEPTLEDITVDLNFHFFQDVFETPKPSFEAPKTIGREDAISLTLREPASFISDDILNYEPPSTAERRAKLRESIESSPLKRSSSKEPGSQQHAGSSVSVRAQSPPTQLEIERLITDGGGELVSCPYARALYDFEGSQDDELALRTGELLQVIAKHDDGWFTVQVQSSSELGVVPGNYLEVIDEEKGKKLRAQAARARYLAQEQLESLISQGDATGIIQQMLTHSEHAAVQQHACAALGNLASDNAVNQRRIREAGGIEAVAGAMRAHKEAAGVQEHAFVALRNLAGNNADNQVNDGNQVKIAGAGGIEALVSAMTAHKDSAGVQQHACWALRTLARNADNKVKIAGAGGIEAVVAAMAAHNSSAEVQEWACAALFNLAFNSNNQVKIAETGGIGAIVASMAAHKATARVLQEACGALYSLAVNDDNKVKISEAGGIGAVVAAMAAHKESARVQEEACAALKNLALNDDNAVKIAETGGIEAVVAAMAAHKATADVQEWACVALCNLAYNAGNQVQIAEAGGIAAVVAAMSAHTASESMQEHACGALCNLAGNADNEAKIAEAGGIEAVVAVMKTHEDRPGVQEEACGALENLAGRSLRPQYTSSLRPHTLVAEGRIH